jgi:hypothetical protein
MTVFPYSFTSELQTTHALKLLIKAPVGYESDQSTIEVLFDIEVTSPACDCTQ